MAPSSYLIVVIFTLLSATNELLVQADQQPRLRGLAASGVSNSWQDEMLAAVNNERAKAYLPSLCSNP